MPARGGHHAIDEVVLPKPRRGQRVWRQEAQLRRGRFVRPRLLLGGRARRRAGGRLARGVPIEGDVVAPDAERVEAGRAEGVIVVHGLVIPVEVGRRDGRRDGRRQRHRSSRRRRDGRLGLARPRALDIDWERRRPLAGVGDGCSGHASGQHLQGTRRPRPGARHGALPRCARGAPARGTRREGEAGRGQLVLDPQDL